ncbi:hypothetical protein OPU71_20270 [Niveibacterium sp. 24ML]|uniref:hypothetical protein n=1 Tax=Niveibacterium sp. 24ML TaxID=2985512 RepID=UPI00226EAED8|nr:hypothetical protein [Niveibacterium sp. 24ML]MCX9158464.1 hypothetical protein [Niveibacterium sp. 24ML]
MAQGYGAFCVRARHLDQFAPCPEHLALSRRIRREEARRQFWFHCTVQSSDAPLYERDLSYPFEGNWYDELRAGHRQRIEQEGSSEEVRQLLDPDTEPVSSNMNDVDPCRAREAIACKRSFEGYLDSTVGLDKKVIAALDQIWERGLVHTLHPIEDNEDSILAFTHAYLADYLGPLGFRLLKKRAGRMHSPGVLWAKKLSAERELRLGVEFYRCSIGKFYTQELGPDAIPYLRPSTVSMELGLHVRRGLTRRFKAEPTVPLDLENLLVAPVHYRFWNPKHIAAAITEWCAIYRVLGSQIEAACIESADPG